MKATVATFIVILIVGGTIDLLSRPSVIKLGYSILSAFGVGITTSLTMIGVGLYMVMLYGVYAFVDRD